jgi:hypothetical protein
MHDTPYKTCTTTKEIINDTPYIVYFHMRIAKQSRKKCLSLPQSTTKPKGGIINIKISP